MARNVSVVQVLWVAVLASSGHALSAEVRCEANEKGHLQGIAIDPGKAIYWSFTRELIKTDIQGAVLARVSVKSHHGDATYHDGKVYVAVGFGAFNKEARRADSWVFVYDGEDLSLVAKHKVPEVVYGAGGIAYHDKRFLIIGGLPKGFEENYAYEYDEAFQFRKRHVLQTGYTKLGIQTVCHHEGFWWFGCYGKKLLKTDEDIRLVGTYGVDCSVGIDGLPDGRFLIARCCKGEDGNAGGRLLIARPDEQKGLVIIENAEP